MMELDISLGNVLTIVSIVIGFFWQNTKIVERVVKTEVKLHETIKHVERHDKDIHNIKEAICELKNPEEHE